MSDFVWRQFGVLRFLCVGLRIGALFILDELHMKTMSESEQTVSYMIKRFEKELRYTLVLRQFDSNIQHIISDEYFDWCKKMLA